MTLQVNEMYLLSHGYRMVAVYGYLKPYSYDKVVCYTNDNGSYIIRLVNSKRTFTLEYDNAKDANYKIKKLMQLGYVRNKNLK